MRKIYSLLLLVFGFTTFAQNSSNEQFPKFPDCVNAIGNQQESCFYNTLQNYFYNNFKGGLNNEVKNKDKNINFRDIARQPFTGHNNRHIE